MLPILELKHQTRLCPGFAQALPKLFLSLDEALLKLCISCAQALSKLCPNWAHALLKHCQSFVVQAFLKLEISLSQSLSTLCQNIVQYRPKFFQSFFKHLPTLSPTSTQGLPNFARALAQFFAATSSRSTSRVENSSKDFSCWINKVCPWLH
jgi:hypothetical protein